MTSPNKKIYIEALFVIRQAYQHTAIIPKEDLIGSLIANLENQIMDLKEVSDTRRRYQALERL